MDEFDEVSVFFDVIFGDHDGIICLGTMSGNSTTNPRAIDESHFWHWPIERDDVLEFVANHDDEDVYVSPMLYKDKFRQHDFVSITPVIWCDADQAAPAVFELPPSMSVQTSPGRWHCYWVYDDDEVQPPLWSAKMAKAIAYRHRDEGAGYEGWQLSKYLRVPGCMNTKPALIEPFQVELELPAEGVRSYSKAELMKVYGDPSTQRGLEAPAAEIPMPASWPDRNEILERLPMDTTMSHLLFNKPVSPSWNETLWALECLLFRKGLHREEVFALVHGCACDKYTRDGRPKEDHWREICKAELEAPNQESNATPGLITSENLNVFSPAPIERPRFITDDEMNKIQDYPNFIDRYVDWARTRTEADPRYHEYGAMCLLSTVLADFGHAVPRFGNLKLNMWFMILGVTTRTYKTTSRKLMLEILNPLNSEDDGYEYKLGSEATPEGIAVELANYPGRSKLYYYDEASKLFGDMRGNRGYMSGFGELLTQLFDGTVSGRLRSSGQTKKIPETETAFNMYLAGVPGKIAEILNEDDFATGFLARFLYVIGRPGPRTDESMRLEQQDENHARVEDPVAKALRAELSNIRYWWSQHNSPGETYPIMVEPDAWERYNQAIKDMTLLAAASEKAEMLEPSTDRMNKHILKLACLLAMADKKDRVSMPYMLRAIYHAEEWYMSMVQVSQLIQTSVWSAQVDKLVQFVRERGTVKWDVAYRQFRALKSKDFQDLVYSATESGFIALRAGATSTDRLLVA